MQKEVMGVSLDGLEAPIRVALRAYQEISGDDLMFDRDKASKLEATPTKTNSARSETDVAYRGEQIGKLYVIAFKPGDGSGSEVNYQLVKLGVDFSYPRDVRIVPRDKTGVHSEGHLAILSHKIDDAHANPELYGGSFDLLGLVNGDTVRKIGELGRREVEMTTAPITTLTVGWQGKERFGDPHAVYSRIPGMVQVCAFLAISDEVHKKYPNILDALIPQLPLR